MSSPQCSAVAADTKVETPEGSMTIRTVAGQAIAVLTRNANGTHLFRLMQDVEKAGELQPVLKLTLENGCNFRLGPQQIVFKHGLLEARAADLVVGDALEPAFPFPSGYTYTDDDGQTITSSGALKITAIESGGAADIYRLSVHQTGTFFLSAGVLCKADGA